MRESEGMHHGRIYESAWRCHIVDAFGGLEIDSITADMIETWMAGMPRGAARKAWGVLRTMLRKAFRWGVSSVDVTTRVMGPKRTDHQPRVLDARQIAALLRGFWGHELEAWLICSATLGLRPEEALGLEWSDIDLRGGLVRIRRGVQWVSGHEVVVEPKTDLSARELVLPPVRGASSAADPPRRVWQACRRPESRAGGPPLQAMVP